MKCASDGQAAVYAEDADDSEILGHLKDGVELEVTEMTDGWCRIRYKSHEGYMIGEDLRIEAAEEEAEDEDASVDEMPADELPTETLLL